MTDKQQPEHDEAAGDKTANAEDKPCTYIAVGIAVGVALGVALGNIGLGIALGLAIGGGMAAKERRKQARGALDDE